MELIPDEGFPSSFFRVDAYASDPDGVVEAYFYDPPAFGAEAELGGPAELPLNEPGEILVRVRVLDDCGAEGADSAIFRIIPPVPSSNRSVFRLEGECAARGDYWKSVSDYTAFREAYAQGGSASSRENSPADLPENRLSFQIPNVSADDAGNYYLFGSFPGPRSDDQCIWVRINGSQWNKWDIINPEKSNYPNSFTLEEGANEVEFAYCSPNLGVDRLVLSPDTRIDLAADSDPYSPGQMLVDLNCPDPNALPDYWIEGECAMLPDTWAIQSNSSASNLTYAYMPKGYFYQNPPPGFARFTLEDVQAGTYFLQARIRSTNGKDDSFYVRINGGEWYSWDRGINRGEGFAWNLLPGGGVYLQDGLNTIDFAGRESNTELDKIFVSGSNELVAGIGLVPERCSYVSTLNPLFLEAECADYGEAWQLRADTAAAFGGYLTTPKGDRMDSPPTEEWLDQIEFEFDVPSYNRYTPIYLYARTKAPTVDANSFWVRFNDGEWVAWTSIATGQDWRWNRFPMVYTSVKTGTNTVTFAVRESGTQLDQIFLNGTDELVEYSPYLGQNCNRASSGAVATEAECIGGINSTNWVPQVSDLASGESYITYSGGPHFGRPLKEGEPETLYFTPSLRRNTGTYRMYLRINAPSEEKNSLWIRASIAGGWKVFEQEADGTPLLTDGFEWRELILDGESVPAFGGSSFRLEIVNREPGIQIDKIAAVNSGSITAFGPFAEPCSPILNRDLRPIELTPAPAAMVYSEIYPNPVVGRLSYTLQSAYRGNTIVRIYDSTGKNMLTSRLDKQSATLVSELDVALFPAGIYRIQFVEGSRQSVRTFIKL
ncbi:T9SS type A sorting domain-containing protein [Lewinella sp. IMCC34191]|uniref:T9SS type A sorting domain-containing protein n=1 Tax=Lewinella sp. IMCC34191 TaxID=2259172 RepID=UPI0013003892|nr:T9SS type A sorting domain-containing protein [Lewinella sp. IMCC34191]